jgi:uncharacterized protein YcbK (DUF882 family)
MTGRLARTTALAFGLALSVSCAPEPDPAREGAAEDDPNVPPGDSGGDEGAGDDGVDAGDDTGDSEVPDADLPTTPVDEVVCYPGEDGAGTTCLPLVSWEAAWGADYTYPEPLEGDPQYSAPIRFIDLDAPEAAADPQLAPNFALSELMQAWKGRFGMFQPHAVSHLQTIRDRIGGPLTVNSGYRNVSYNAGVGGATWSRHQYGDAADMRSDAASLDELGALCGELGAGYIGYYDTHVHCDWRDDPLEPAFFAEAATLIADGGVLRVSDVDGPEGRLRVRWAALDAAERTLSRAEGEAFRPPAGAARVHVDIGGVRTLSVRLAAAPTAQ